MKRLFILATLLGFLISTGLSSFAGGFPWPMFMVPPLGSPKVQNRIKTEKLDGCWSFNYTILSNWTTNVCLAKTTVTEGGSDVFYISGFDENGYSAIGGYSPVQDYYHVLINGPVFSEYFTFDFRPSSTFAVEGCYYQFDPASGSLSSCFPMTGNTRAVRISGKSVSTAKQNADLSKQHEIAEFSKVQTKAAVKRDIFESLSELRESIKK